jgi:hypothetical protein
VHPDYTVVQYIADLRAIRSTGSATAETSFYPPLDRLFNATGQALKPAILFSTQLRNSGAGLPDGGFFPQPMRQRRNAEPELLQNPERGVVEIKPADYDLVALAAEPQTIRYLRQYGLVLITNFRQFRLLGLDPAGGFRPLENYTLAVTATDLWSAPLTSFAKHNDLFPDFLSRVMLYRAPLVQPTRGKPTLTLEDLDARLRTFFLEVYHRREHGETKAPPAERWGANSFLPRMPDSLEQLDLLLIHVA